MTAATRRSAPHNLVELGVRIAQGDADEPGQLERWVRGHGLVIDAAAPYPLGSYASYGSGSARVFARAQERTRALLAAVRAHASRLGFVSSFTTLPRPAAGRFEAELRRRMYPYFELKARIEAAVLSAALPCVVVNPTACLGPWETRRSDASLVYLALTGRLPVVARDVVNVVDTRDVAEVLLRALERGMYARPIAVAGHNLPLSELVERVCLLGRVTPPVCTLDARTASLFALWAEAAFASMGREVPRAVHAAPLIADAWPMAPSAEQRELGVTPRALHQTLRDAVNWQLQAG